MPTLQYTNQLIVSDARAIQTLNEKQREELTEDWCQPNIEFAVVNERNDILQATEDPYRYNWVQCCSLL